MKTDFLPLAIIAAIKAGGEIMQVYATDFSVENKTDNSPLTVADRRAHTIIKETLLSTDLPLMSEEGEQLDYTDRKDWATYWLVDPLDGTKEFIKKNGEFTVNIALIKNNYPVMGVVYVPVTKQVFYGGETSGSFKFMADDLVNIENISSYLTVAEKLPLNFPDQKYTIVASRSHMSAETEDFIEKMRSKYGETDLVSAGSSLKLCLVAEGKAHVYPRLAPTMEWDTAAGHAVAKFSGCKVYDYKTGQELQYNKENLLNPFFVVERDV